MIGRVIETDEDVAEGAAWLAAREPRFAAALEMTGPPPLRRHSDGFATLFAAIVSQQVSVASAAAVWAKVEALGAHDPARLVAATDAELRGCGLSRQKISYGRALAESGVDFVALRSLPDADVIAELVRVKGSASGPPRSTRCSASAGRMSSPRAISRFATRSGCSSISTRGRASPRCAR